MFNNRSPFITFIRKCKMSALDYLSTIPNYSINTVLNNSWIILSIIIFGLLFLLYNLLSYFGGLLNYYDPLDNYDPSYSFFNKLVYIVKFLILNIVLLYIYGLYLIYISIIYEKKVLKEDENVAFYVMQNPIMVTGMTKSIIFSFDLFICMAMSYYFLFSRSSYYVWILQLTINPILIYTLMIGICWSIQRRIKQEPLLPV